MGCSNQDCQLCKNNPHKTCTGGENFDEAYADNQILKARCEAEVHIELVNQLTGEVFSAPGVEVQVSAKSHHPEALIMPVVENKQYASREKET